MERDEYPVRKATVPQLLLFLLFLSFPRGAGAQPQQSSYWYMPVYCATVDEAMGRLKNLQPTLMSPEEGVLRSLEVDRYGIRFFWSAGNATVIPFEKVTRMRIFKHPDGKMNNPWFVAARVSEEGVPPLIRTSTRENAEALFSILASFTAAAGHPLDLRGEMGGSSNNPSQKDLQAAKLKKPAGVVVTLLDVGGPSEKAGLQVGDIILRVNGYEVENYEKLEKDIWPKIISASDVFDLDILRGGKPQAIRVRCLAADALPKPPATLTFSPSGPASRPSPGHESQPPKLGFTLRNLTAAEKKAIKGKSGAVVMEIRPGGLAEAMKMQAGDILLYCNGKAVPSAEGLSALLVEGENSFLVSRKGAEITLSINTIVASY